MLRYLQEIAERFTQRLSRIGAVLVRPIDRLVGGAADKVLSATEHVDRVESLFVKILKVVFWPLLFLVRILKALLPAPLVRVLASLGQNLQRLTVRLGERLLDLAGILNLDRLVLGIVWLLQPIWRPLAALGEFVVCWLNSRDYRSALMALPALILGAAVLGVGAWHSMFGQAQIRSAYRNAALESRKTHSYELTELLDQKLAQLGEDTQLTQYRTALALADEDKLDEAYERMRQLAPEDRPGYPSAHFWIIQRLINGDLNDSNEESRRLARIHLDHLQALEINAPFVQLLNAIWLVQDGQLEKATDVLEPLVPVMPNAAFERMRINLALNRREQARQDARAVVTHMKTRTRADGEMGTTEFQWWLSAEEVLGNVQQMRTILEMWHKADPENEVAKKALSTVCRQLAGNMLRAPIPDEEKIVELWLRAAKLDNSSDALLRLARALYAERESTPVYSRILAALHKSPQSPTELLIAVGTEAALQQQFEDARPFFAAAVAKDESNAVAWNNYGLVLGEGPDAKLEEALEAVERALQISPEEYRFRETRGQILLKMERWKEAVDELEFSLNGLPNLNAIHESLARAYTALGNTELARLHEMQAE